MASRILTVEAAKAADIDVIDNGRYTQVVRDTVIAMRANRRSGTASVKTKATVSGSGAKPWRQKGTGRARAGYKSSPVWVGGGVVFGPHPRDYSKKVAKNVKKLAFRKALSERIKSGDVLHVDDFSIGEPKTRKFIARISAITKEPKTLIISEGFDAMTYLAARNVQPALLMTAAEVNTEHLLNFRKIVITSGGLTQIANRLAVK
jgi:large subunit ribosomal protein L4